MAGSDPLKLLEEEARKAIADALAQAGFPSEHVSLERPPAELKADFAFPCFMLAKAAKKAPAQLASELASSIKLGDGFESCRAEGPYVNFVISPKRIVRETMEALASQGADFGAGEPKGVKAIVEHTSANPTDQLHVGRGRNPIIGDTIARIMRKAGYEVETQYYVDDLGKQAATKFVAERLWDEASQQIEAIGMERPENSPLFFALPPNQQAELKEKLALLREPGRLSKYAVISTCASCEAFLYSDERMRKITNRITGIVNSLERGHPETTAKVAGVVDEAMEADIKPTLSRLGISIDGYVHESGFMEPTRDIIQRLKASGQAGEEDGAYYIDMEKYGVSGRSTKFFFARGDGTSLYATRDVAYHLWKFEQVGENGILVNVLGEDHKLESRQIATALELLGHKRAPEVIFYAFVTLPEGKMSTRKGRVVYLSELVEEAVARALEEVRKRRGELTEEQMARIAELVGVGAVRYNIIRVQPEKKIVFRWEDALNMETGSAPFIQYSHARACSILRKAAGDAAPADYSLLVEGAEVALVKALAAFPGLVQECAEHRSAHPLAIYAQDVASLFNAFYRDCPVLSAEGGLMGARLALVQASKAVLASALGLLGVAAPEEM